MPSSLTASQEELKAAKVPLAWRDQCSAYVPTLPFWLKAYDPQYCCPWYFRLLIPLNTCRRENYYLPWTCENERHGYEKWVRSLLFYLLRVWPIHAQQVPIRWVGISTTYLHIWGSFFLQHDAEDEENVKTGTPAGRVDCRNYRSYHLEDFLKNASCQSMSRRQTMQQDRWMVWYAEGKMLLCAGVLHFPPCLFLKLWNFLFYPLNNFVWCAALPKRFNELPIWIHEVDVYWMVDEVVTLGICIRRGGEVDAVGFACGFHGFIVTRETDDTRVKVCEICLHLRDRVSCRVNRDEYRLEDCPIILLCIWCGECVPPLKWLMNTNLEMSRLSQSCLIQQDICRDSWWNQSRRSSISPEGLYQRKACFRESLAWRDHPHAVVRRFEIQAPFLYEHFFLRRSQWVKYGEVRTSLFEELLLLITEVVK